VSVKSKTDERGLAQLSAEEERGKSVKDVEFHVGGPKNPLEVDGEEDPVPRS